MLWFIFTLIYASVATLAMYMTWHEHILKKRKSVIWTLLGLAACVLWPATLAAVGVSASRDQR